MCTIINFSRGAIAILGNNCHCAIKNQEHCIDLFIQYGNQAIQPIQIQINEQQWSINDNEEFYINALKSQECTAKLYDVNQKLL